MIKLEKYRLCDFCNSNDVHQYRWIFKEQTIPAGTDIDFLFQLMEHPEWFACPVCHELIKQNNLTGLLDNNKGITPKNRPYFAKLYSSLLQNLVNN